MVSGWSTNSLDIDMLGPPTLWLSHIFQVELTCSQEKLTSSLKVLVGIYEIQNNFGALFSLKKYIYIRKN